MNLLEIQKQITDRFLGETCQRYDNNIAAILACPSLDKLIQVSRELTQEDTDHIFQSCTARDTLSAKFNPRECAGVFLRLKTVSLNSDFI